MSLYFGLRMEWQKHDLMKTSARTSIILLAKDESRLAVYVTKRKFRPRKELSHSSLKNTKAMDDAIYFSLQPKSNRIE